MVAAATAGLKHTTVCLAPTAAAAAAAVAAAATPGGNEIFIIN